MSDELNVTHLHEGINLVRLGGISETQRIEEETRINKQLPNTIKVIVVN